MDHMANCRYWVDSCLFNQLYLSVSGKGGGVQGIGGKGREGVGEGVDKRRGGLLKKQGYDEDPICL